MLFSIKILEKKSKNNKKNRNLILKNCIFSLNQHNSWFFFSSNNIFHNKLITCVNFNIQSNNADIFEFLILFKLLYIEQM